MKRCLLIELWGLGDAVLMTSALQGLMAAKWHVTVLGKAASRELLASSYPEVKFIEFSFPWTAFTKKYHLPRWPWLKLVRLLAEIRKHRFHAVASVRPDPRDHVLMWLSGARRRIGFPSKLRLFSPPCAQKPFLEMHLVERWQTLVDQIEEARAPRFSPWLRRNQPPEKSPPHGTPLIALHCGAGQAVRRWPDFYLAEILSRMTRTFSFRLLLFPDGDGYGQKLSPFAEETVPAEPLEKFVRRLSDVRLFIGNDSGPAHIAAALGVPTATFFGPQRPEWFRPYGVGHLVLSGSPCPHRPCFDSCRFPEPYCLTRLTPDHVWPQLRKWLDEKIPQR